MGNTLARGRVWASQTSAILLQVRRSGSDKNPDVCLLLVIAILVPLDHLAVTVDGDQRVLVLENLFRLGTVSKAGNEVVGNVEGPDGLDVAEGDTVYVELVLEVIDET
mmetsp:Transcript_9213/g.9878  ORF Transcript_9213/g.9878 Transcript_9213/m.9878 type:complete len:108 (-) Transcript_9213:450-773(-)